MEIGVKVLGDKWTVIVNAWGKLDFNAVAKSIPDMVSLPAIQAGYNVVLDFHEVDGAFSVGQLRKLASVHRKYKDKFKNNRAAIIVKPEDVSKAHILCMLIRTFGIKIEAYGDKESAYKYVVSGQSWL